MKTHCHYFRISFCNTLHVSDGGVFLCRNWAELQESTIFWVLQHLRIQIITGIMNLRNSTKYSTSWMSWRSKSKKQKNWTLVSYSLCHCVVTSSSPQTPPISLPSLPTSSRSPSHSQITSTASIPTISSHTLWKMEILGENETSTFKDFIGLLTLAHTVVALFATSHLAQVPLSCADHVADVGLLIKTAVIITLPSVSGFQTLNKHWDGFLLNLISCIYESLTPHTLRAWFVAKRSNNRVSPHTYLHTPFNTTAILPENRGPESTPGMKIEIHSSSIPL